MSEEEVASEQEEQGEQPEEQGEAGVETPVEALRNLLKRA